MPVKRKFSDPFLTLDNTDNLNNANNSSVDESDSSSEPEKEDQRRLQLAKNYLKKLKAENTSETSQKNKISGLKVRPQKKTTEIASKFAKENVSITKSPLTKHSQTPTSLAVSPDGRFVYSAAKDGSIAKWDAQNGARVALRKKPKRGSASAFEGHFRAVLGLALSADGKLLASGGSEKSLLLWDAESLRLLHRFRGHSDAVSSLLFVGEASKLYSASFDRTVRSWNTASMTFVESLFGHQNEANGLAAFDDKRVLACGSDRTLRLFKISEGTQLIFKAFDVHSAPIDCCAFLSRGEFVAGSQDGALSLWSTSSKKPAHVVRNAHGGKWVVSVAAFKNSDLFATGSSDGFVRLWKRAEDKKTASKLIQINQIAVEGFANCLAFGSDPTDLFVAAGREHRLGRWEVNRKAENRIFKLKLGNAKVEA